MQHTVELVIFDCDGVLVDSEPIVNQVFRDMLAELGLHYSLEDMYSHFMGRPMQRCMELVQQRLGHAPPERFVEEFTRRAGKVLRQQLQPVPGIEKVLDQLPVPYCVASSGDHAKMRLTLGITGLLDRFTGRIFSVTDVRLGKPHPDVFLHAARSMQVPPASTAVIEDSVVGVNAGVAAGMQVFGFAALTSPAELAAAGAQVFTEMSALPSLLGLQARDYPLHDHRHTAADPSK